MKELKDYKIVCIDGETYRLVPENEFNEKICPQEQQKKTGWERAEIHKDYFTMSSLVCGEREVEIEDNSGVDNYFYDFGNYFTDTMLAKNISRAVSLWLRMLRWRAENDKPITRKGWADDTTRKYFVSYDYERNLLDVGSWIRIRDPFQIYFSSKEKVKESMEQFKGDLIWYFTEFKSRMDG